MAKFYVKPDNLKSCESDLASCANEILKIADAVNTCQKSLAFSSASTQAIKIGLQSRYEELLEEAVRMSTIKEAILKIANYYDSTEVRIIENSGDRSEESPTFQNIPRQYSSVDTNDVFSIIKYWRNRITGNYGPSPYNHTTAEMERAHDKEMRRQIDALLSDNERFSEEYWRGASIEERKIILEEYMAMVASIMGVNINSDIIFYSEGSQNGGIRMGTYDNTFSNIQINEYVLSDNSSQDSYELMKTIVHECRHAYQHRAIENPDVYIVSNDTIQSWKEGFSTYDAESDRGLYYNMNLSVERDAREFADQSLPFTICGSGNGGGGGGGRGF